MDKPGTDIKGEFRSIVRDLKARLEYERIFGVKSVCLASQPPESQPVTEGVFDGEIDMKTVAGRAMLLADLRAEVSHCTLCQLHTTRNNVVFGEGDADAGLMFVGEAPGRSEDEKGQPFVGRAGVLLTKIINAIDLERDNVYIANILKCRPPGNRNPNGDEINLCAPHLIRQIDLIKPKIICALGTFAAQTLLDSTETIGNLRGKLHDYRGMKLMATYHPAYLLRNPGAKRDVWGDMQKVRDYLRGSDD